MVQPQFGLGYVLAGMAVRAFDIENAVTGWAPTVSRAGGRDGFGPTTSYELGSTVAQEPGIEVGTNMIVRPGQPGRAVQGRQTRHRNEAAYRILYVLRAANGQTVAIAGGKSFAELHRIGDGLVLPQ